MHDQTCPSVAHVLDRIDGGLARVRLPGGRLPAAQLRAVAETAVRFGSGTIEITNRANLQLRGIRTDTAAALAVTLEAAGVSYGAAGDLRRNVLSGPLAGLDPSEVADTRPLVAAIIEQLTADPALDGLSPKTGVVVDGGGEFHLGGRRDDVVVTAVSPGHYAVLTATGPVTAGAPMVVEDVPMAVHSAVAGTMNPGGARALAAVPLRAGASRVAIGPLGPCPSGRESSGRGSSGRGSSGSAWVGAMPLLGRMSAVTAIAVADLAEDLGDGEVRLTPWRGLVLPGVLQADTATVADRLGQAGLVADRSDPRVAVVSCAGSLGCTSGHTDAPAHALAAGDSRCAAGAAPLGIHFSACAKRCAQREPAAVTLVGVPGGCYDAWVADIDAPAGERLVASGLAAEAAVSLAALGAGSGGHR